MTDVATGEQRVPEERRPAVAELGAALRELTEAAVATEVDSSTLLDVARQVRQLVPKLTAVRRERGELPSVDGKSRHERNYNPVVGRGHPYAPPLEVEVSPGKAVGTCVLGLAHEGPPSYAHGGVSAMLLDQMLGHAHAASGKPGMTVRLNLRYRRPVPLRTPLLLQAQVVDEAPGRWTESVATITTCQDPDRVLVEAQARFVVPSAEQAKRIFGNLLRNTYS